MASKPFQIPNSIICVTGASAGIGHATCVRLEKAGARLAMAARRVERLQELRATFQFPGEHMPIAMDVTNPESVRAAFAAIRQKFGKLDALVANAGVGAWHRVDETPEEEVRRILDTNVVGVVRCIREAVPLLRAAGGGRIVLVSSIVGRRGVPMMGLYSASKFALHGLADAMRIELANDHITVSTICPQLTRTEFHDAATGDKGQRPPDGEGEPPEAIGGAIHDLLVSGAAEVHRSSVFSPKRWIGVLTQMMPRVVDRKLAVYYQQRREQNGAARR